MYTMKILEREPALSHFLSAHLRALSSAPAGRADLVVVSPDLIQVPSAPTACRALLAPGSLAHLAGELSAAWVVSYGLTPRDTLTFSSLGQDTLCLALQRELVTLSGDCLEPQEWPLPRQSQASPLFLLACAGLQLLLGVPPAEVRLGRGSGASLST